MMVVVRFVRRDIFPRLQRDTVPYSTGTSVGLPLCSRCSCYPGQARLMRDSKRNLLRKKSSEKLDPEQSPLR